MNISITKTCFFYRVCDPKVELRSFFSLRFENQASFFKSLVTPRQVVQYVEVEVGARVQIPLNQAENEMEIDDLWKLKVKYGEKDLEIEMHSGKKGKDCKV